MHAIKGSWVGQTFALAKLNESGGRKTRIRRSKEERKTMVESFIKKYQKLNNGSFPSLSLTHKEVGGSFYTVREIVREIIQENRVLGPAKLTNSNTDIFSEQYPLGSIAVEPQIHVDLSNESHTVIHVLPNQCQDESEELARNWSGHYNELQHLTSGDGKISNIESEIPMKIESEICIEGEKDVEIIEKENVLLEAHNQKLENGKIVNEHTVEIGTKYDSNQSRSIVSEMYEPTAKGTEMKTEIPMHIESEICIEGEKDEDKIETENVLLEAHNQKLENGNIVNGHTGEIGTKYDSNQSISIQSEMCESTAKGTEMKTEIPMHIESEICIEGEKDEEKLETENVLLEAHNQKLENGNFVTGHTIEIGTKDDSDQWRSIETEMLEPTSKVTRMKTEIVIETFPLRPMSSNTTTFGVDKRNIDKNEADKIEMNSEEISSCLAPEKVEANLAADSLSESSLLLGDEIDTSFQSDVSHETDLKAEDELPAKKQSMNSPNGVCIENLINTNTHDSHGPSISEETVEINNIKPDIHLHDGSTKIRDPTLDRINLESWEATSKKSGRSEINPFFEIIKAFIAAFVKFWSE